MNSVIQKLKHNTWLKIIALFFAVLLWSYVISATDPTRLRNVKDIAIQANGYEPVSYTHLSCCRGCISPWSPFIRRCCPQRL